MDKQGLPNNRDERTVWGGWSYGYLSFEEVLKELNHCPEHKVQNTGERTEITIIRHSGSKVYVGDEIKEKEPKPFTSWKVKFYE